METFYSGSLTIEIEEDGCNHEGRDRVKGAIILQDGTRWEFSDLCSGVQGFRSLLEAAESAISFGSYYSSDNRGDDAPEWAPPGEVASEIRNQAAFAPDPLPAGWPERGDCDEDETVWVGDLYAVFDSPEAQRRWWDLADSA